MRIQFERTIQQRNALKEQLHEVKLKVINDFKEAELEGEMLKRQAMEEIEAKKHKELQRKRMEIENAQAVRLANLEIELQHRKKVE